MDHQPDSSKWRIVSTDHCVYLSTECTCGNDECWWNATASPRDIYNPTINQTLKG